MYCKKCGTENEKDALFCKKCGANLIEEYKNELDAKEPARKEKKQKTKTKTKVKNKVKKVKEKSGSKKGKKQVVVERKMGLFSKIVMFLLILFVLGLLAVCGVLGYELYSNENIEVPNVVTMTYEEAEFTLSEKELNIEKSEKIVEDESQVGIVLEQSKKAGKKVSKNTVIKVTVGVLDDSITVPDVVGMNLDQAKNELNHLDISYTVSYQEVDDGEDNIILKQSPKKNSKIKKGEKIALTVSKKVESNSDISKEEEEAESGVEE